jgi:hypothetical protein
MERILRIGRIWLMGFCLAAGSTVYGCGATDLKDNLVAGAMVGVKNAATAWVTAFLPDATDFFPNGG